ncbi:hypothetical protein KY092_13305 [Natronomonas gomsonensis]|uniref:hypothetical protein n=1 Tax=Natronomonas gomsonensis TaxID=1046043 RepID=UPI0020CA95BC|nr:hypothetical protein [Natronomonas gomsonensis]MCY4731531.1 hypothetical protein [Natronomonas gomsonensis]
MRSDRAVVAATIAVVIGVSVASGPLVGLSLTDEQSFAPGSGTANVTVETVPDTATLTQSNYGSGPYTLRLDPARIRVSTVSGQPTIAYELAVEGLNHSRTSVTFLDDGYEGRYDLAFSPSTIAPDRVDETRYDGMVRVYVYDERSDRLLVERNVTIEVKR